MQRQKQMQSPPKHRHDGTSPLPLGMDWSPPPKKWNGQETVWPHDPQTGWSYCVTIPSWVIRPKSKDSDPIVFYRVLIGLQSPEGFTTTRYVLRRFNDFLKFVSALKTAFPRKSLPPAPPKGLLRMKTRALLEERRRLLEEWITRLLSDIDVSRSFVVASFLELEAAARSSFRDENLQSSPAITSPNSASISSSQVHLNSNLSTLPGSSSVTSDYGSDTAYEASEVGTASLGQDNNSEIGIEDLSLDEELTSPIDKFMKYGMSNIDEGLFMGQAILEQLEGFPSKHKLPAGAVQNALRSDSNNENGFHGREISAEGSESDVSSQKGSESPSLATRSVFENGADFSRTPDVLGNLDLRLPDDVHLVLPQDQGQKMNRVLATMQRRLVTARTDMEDLISRLNQEIAVKEYLTTKVKDLDVELEATKQKSKENIEQAILIERERVTQMQWDMEELKRKSLELELKLNSEQGNKVETMQTSFENKDVLQELDLKRQQLDDLTKQYQELELKSKADIKVLVKEVKSLRSSQAQMKQQLNESIEGKSAVEILLQQERHKNERMRAACGNLLEKCATLFEQLQNCDVDFLKNVEADQLVNFPSSSDALERTVKSDDQIDMLLTEVQQLPLGAADDASSASAPADETNSSDDDDDVAQLNRDLRKMAVRILADNCSLRKKMNSVSRRALRLQQLSEHNK
ncbi:OLC1v1027994C1 [Oldenlandia corymbosa var. corymbosa]|uniref:OLC1v1027994C1 n=1 Tax=Oldenlandia corymbosa var. corymbosa TaxID=529605 RepID=A0AAV1CCY4_OLDCO|nr:OLC1v1027994C1 [Oldenlandia corymbosa var. corymbosa]